MAIRDVIVSHGYFAHGGSLDDTADGAGSKVSDADLEADETYPTALWA